MAVLFVYLSDSCVLLFDDAFLEYDAYRLKNAAAEFCESQIILIATWAS